MVTIYEIYPQSETPHLTKVAHLKHDLLWAIEARILPGTFKVIWYTTFYIDGIEGMNFWVWDYRLNHSISFSIDVAEAIDFRVDSESYPEVYILTFG